MASIEARDTTRGRRYDVRFRLANGDTRKRTFRTKREASTFAAATETDKSRGGLVDPRAGKMTLAEWSDRWIADRPQLRPRTVTEYRGVLDRHVLPALGATELGRLDVAGLRSWHAGLIRTGVGRPTVAKAYRVLRAVLNTAVEDGRLIANPCQLKGAGVERPAERPTITPAETWALADAVPAGRRALVLLGGFAGLRLGEALGLAVRHVDPLHRAVTVERQLQEMSSGAQVLTDPKSEAGRRVVPLPATVVKELLRHVERFTAGTAEELLFLGDKGGPLRRHVFNAEFRAARQSVGLAEVRFHDLRHSALTMLAATGATVAELQAHAGHASPAAALRYQHATQERGRALADLVDQVIGAPVERPAPVEHLSVPWTRHEGG